MRIVILEIAQFSVPKIVHLLFPLFFHISSTLYAFNLSFAVDADVKTLLETISETNKTEQ